MGHAVGAVPRLLVQRLAESLRDRPVPLPGRRMGPAGGYVNIRRAAVRAAKQLRDIPPSY